MTDGQEQDAEDVVVLVCMTCGQDHRFEKEERPPPDLACATCGHDLHDLNDP